MDFLNIGTGGWMGALGSLAVIMLTHVSNKYVIPFLKVGQRQKYARYIAQIADEITDDLKLKYPDRKWVGHLDEAVDSLIKICGIDQEVAQRAVNAALKRNEA